MLLQTDFIDMSNDSELNRAFNSFKDLPKETIIPLMHAAILGESILFVADKYSFNSIISILSRFHYRPVFRKVYVTTSRELYGDYHAIGVLTKAQITKNLLKKSQLSTMSILKKSNLLRKRRYLVL
ncbi:MAG: hypothetical protein ACFE9L_07310 [Candidatus Hodarchaeota archaeon]